MAQTGSLAMEIEEDMTDNVVDLSGLCRMCACTCPETNDTSLQLAFESTLTEKLREYLNIKVEEDQDYLPRQICHQCYDALNQWSAIRETVKRSEDFYHRQVELRNLDFDPKFEPTSVGSNQNDEMPQFECTICHEMFSNAEYLSMHQLSHNLCAPTTPKRTRYQSKSNKYDFSDFTLVKKEVTITRVGSKSKDSTQNRESIILPTPSASIVVTPIIDELEKIDNINYPCGKCQLTFESFDSFVQHTQTHSYLRELPCGICGCYFRNKQLLMQHVLEHRTNPDKQVAFTCDLCNNVYSSRKNLLAHFSYRHTPSKKKTLKIDEPDTKLDIYVCGTCKDSFKGITEFAEHFPKKHVIFYELSCGVCDARFKRLPNLLVHEQNHKDNPDVDISFRCSQCDKVFSEQRNLTHHIQNKHPKEKPTKTRSKNYVELPEDELNSTSTGSYSCGACKVVYPNLLDFSQHFERVHPMFNQLPCGVCGVQFRKVHCLIQHEQMHKKLPDEQITFSCEFCDRKFSATRNLNQHVAKHHPDRELSTHTSEFQGPSDYQTLSELQGTSKDGFTCNECHQIFYNQTQFNKHCLKHVLNRCPVCQFGFERKRQLTIHMKEVHPNYKNEGKTLPCPVCGKLFKAAQTLKVHIELHSAERNYVCEICAKSYRSLSTLYKHKQSHADKPKFECEICNRTFTFKAAMKKHIMLHVDYLPFKCNKCGRRFTGLGLLKNHKIKKHDTGTPHHCIRCRKGFKDSRNWRRHMRTVCRVPLEEIPY
ncbi:hypothetical protein B566_EDAN014430, partial [Ephemera danica]